MINPNDSDELEYLEDDAPILPSKYVSGLTITLFLETDLLQKLIALTEQDTESFGYRAYIQKVLKEHVESKF